MPRPVKKQEARLSPDERRAQATLIMMERLFGGKTLGQIGSQFGLSVPTVQRRLALARHDGVPDAAREVFIRDMLPQSMVVLQEALAGDDIRLAVAVALKVVEGLKAMEAPGAASLGAAVEESLEHWKLTRRRVDGTAAGAASDAAAAEGEFTEASLPSDAAVPVPLRLPSASVDTATAPATGDSAGPGSPSPASGGGTDRGPAGGPQ